MPDDRAHERLSSRPPIEADRRSLLIALIVAAVGRQSVLDAVAAPVPPPAPQTSPTQADWELVLRTMFPHERVDAALFSIPAGALVDAAAKDPATRALLVDGWSQLGLSVGGPWSAAPVEARLAALERMAATSFFALLRQTAVFTFYANPKVWEGVGYEGDAWRFGGYAGPSLDSLDWLPSPPNIRGARR